MGLINWIFDFYQQYRIDELRRETVEFHELLRQIDLEDGNLDGRAPLR